MDAAPDRAHAGFRADTPAAPCAREPATQHHRVHASLTQRLAPVGQVGARQPEITARLPRRPIARRNHASDSATTLRRAHYFLGSPRSAPGCSRPNRRLPASGALSSRKAFSSFTSSISIAPYYCFQRQLWLGAHATLRCQSWVKSTR
jgi:hypothetical protein